MTAVITTNNPDTRDTTAPPPALKEDGENYRWRMFFDNGQRIADSDYTADLLDVLSPGYNQLDEVDKYSARIALGQRVVQMGRAAIVSAISPEEAEDMPDWEWNVLTYSDDADSSPFGWGNGEGVLGELKPDVVDFWSSEKPLVLAETSYAPFTDVPAPLSSEGDYSEYVSNIIWIRPFDEEEFLRSLSRIGYISFGHPRATERIDRNARPE